MRYLVLSTSLSPTSRSRVLSRAAAAELRAIGDEVVELDLAELDPPLCGGPGSWEHPATAALQSAIESADGVVLATGIYNYSASAAAKTAVELGGSAWTGKVVSLLCAAGGQSSYMSGMSLLNALMLDFRCLVVPRFVYATGDSFDREDVVDMDVRRRLEELAHEQHRLTSALCSVA